MQNKLRLVFWTFLVLCVAQRLVGHQSQFRQPAFVESFVEESSEKRFFERLEQAAARHYEEFKARSPALSRESYNTFTRILIQKLRQFGEFKSLLARYGKRVSQTALITELLTCFLFPPILAFLGQPQLALISFSLPHSIWTSSLSVYWLRKQSERELREVLGVESLDELRKLKSDILGFDVRNRLGPILLRTLQDEAPNQIRAEVLSMRKAGSSLAWTPSVLLGDLEAIVRNSGSEGALYLDSLFRAKLDSIQSYAYLMRYICESPELLSKLSELIKPAEQDLRSLAIATDPIKTLLQMDTLAKEHAKIEKSYAEMLAKVKGATRWFSKERKESAELSDFIRADMYELNLELKRQEFLFLQLIRDSHPYDVSVFLKDFDRELGLQWKLFDAAWEQPTLNLSIFSELRRSLLFPGISRSRSVTSFCAQQWLPFLPRLAY